MRVIAGIYKNRLLEFKKTKQVRPTRQIVKKSFFDTVFSYISDCIFIDFFAGNGFMGLEALSRGAKKAIFVDKDDSYIKKNLKLLNIPKEKYDIYKMDALDFLSLDVVKDADIIYIDAPYAIDVSKILVFLLNEIKKDAIVCLESAKALKHERIFKTRKIGNNILNYLR